MVRQSTHKKPFFISCTYTHTQTINKSFTFFPRNTHRRQGLCVWLVRNEEIKFSIVLPISAAVTMRCLRLTHSPDGTQERERAIVEEKRERWKRLKHSFWVERQVLLTFNSVCATWCRGYDANEGELKVARGLALMDCSLAALTLSSVHQRRLLCN